MIFVHLKNAYDAIYRERFREILVGYGVGPNMIRLIMFFWIWENATLVFRTSERLGTQFKSCPGVTQGGPLSPKLFNIVVDAIVMEWLCQVLGEEASMMGIGASIRYFVALFYAGDGYLASTDT